ncbi:hypothetical protein C8R46DRAFT_491007 [Mycena filopes]|nr:hypothetical protein C8R46DRAFT_491007 [Mycena filopes]
MGGSVINSLLLSMNLAKGFAFLGRGVLRSVTSRSIHSAGSSVPPFRLGDTTFRHRPWRFWDMHIPPTAFGYEPRDSDKTRDSEYSSYNRVAGPTLPVPPEARTIPNTHLPSPWTCEWSNWRVRRRAEEITLDEFTQEIRHKYGIPGALNPIIFHNTHLDTQPVSESRGMFYLFDNNCDGRRHHRLYKFPGVYVSVEDFFDKCYWNEMEVVKRAEKANSPIPTIASPETLALTHSDRGLRLASAEPYRKRYLLDMTMPKVLAANVNDRLADIHSGHLEVRTSHRGVLVLARRSATPKHCLVAHHPR